MDGSLLFVDMISMYYQTLFCQLVTDLTIQWIKLSFYLFTLIKPLVMQLLTCNEVTNDVCSTMSHIFVVPCPTKNFSKHYKNIKILKKLIRGNVLRFIVTNIFDNTFEILIKYDIDNIFDNTLILIDSIRNYYLVSSDIAWLSNPSYSSPILKNLSFLLHNFF